MAAAMFYSALREAAFFAEVSSGVQCGAVQVVSEVVVQEQK